MNLKKIKLENFKKFANLELSLKPNNLIEGKNGEGKSTIKDAVFFCFYGRTSGGSLSDATKYIRDGETKCTVEIEFEQGGESFIVRRERTEKQTRITLIDGSQSDEDSVITQRELDSLVPDYELMQCVFNIGYFMRLPDADKRRFLLRLTPEIDKKKIFLDMLGFEKADYIALYRLNFEDIGGTHKNLLRLNRENNEELLKINAIVKDSKPIEIPKMTIADPSEELEKLKQIEKDNYSIKLQWSIYDNKVSENIAIALKNDNIKDEISELVIEDISKPSDEKLNSLIKQKNECQPTIHIPENKCPTCLQDIAIEHKNKVAEVNRLRIEKITELSKNIEFERQVYGLALASYQSNELQKRKKESLENDLKNIEPIEAPKEIIQSLDIEKEKRLDEQFFEYQREKLNIALLEKQEKARIIKLNELRESISGLVNDINRINELLPIFSPNGITAEEMRIKLTPILEKMREFIPTIRIETIENLKNGLDIREVFSVYVDEIEYSKLSHGQAMEVDISLSQVIDDLAGNQVEVFFADNCESIDHMPKIKKQSFISIVSPNKSLIIT